MTNTAVELTERQEEILRYVASHVDKFGHQPSFRELMDHFDIKSPNGISCHFKAMERKGVLLVNRRASRAIIFSWKDWL